MMWRKNQHHRHLLALACLLGLGVLANGRSTSRHFSSIQSFRPRHVVERTVTTRHSASSSAAFLPRDFLDPLNRPIRSGRSAQLNKATFVLRGGESSLSSVVTEVDEADTDSDETELAPLPLDRDDKVQLLIEIVGARRLSMLKTNTTKRRMRRKQRNQHQNTSSVVEEIQVQAQQKQGIHPYVVIKVDGREVHRTKPLLQPESDPIWTIRTGSLCLLELDLSKPQNGTMLSSILGWHHHHNSNATSHKWKSFRPFSSSSSLWSNSTRKWSNSTSSKWTSIRSFSSSSWSTSTRNWTSSFRPFSSSSKSNTTTPRHEKSHLYDAWRSMSLTRNKGQKSSEQGRLVTLEIYDDNQNHHHHNRRHQDKPLGIIAFTEEQLWQLARNKHSERIEIPVQKVGATSTTKMMPQLHDKGHHLQIGSSSDKSKEKHAKLALRCREANHEDIMFMDEVAGASLMMTRVPFRRARNSRPIEVNQTLLGDRASDLAFHEVGRRKGSPLDSWRHLHRKRQDGVNYYCVPMPQSEARSGQYAAIGVNTSNVSLPVLRSSATDVEYCWMTSSDIDKVAHSPSQKWVHAGHGTVGVLHVEVLSCDNLPDLDKGGLTDPFVGLVFEDNMVRTDLLSDTLNPRWMPWNMRAFAFHVRHPASLLFAGAFDHDTLDAHDPVGRVVIDIAKLYPNKNYVMEYALQHDPSKTNETDRGTIKLRLRLEWKNELTADRIANFETPTRFIVNCHEKKPYNVLRYLVHGPVEMEKATMETIRLYSAELAAIWLRFCHFLDIVFEILLWRGHVEFTKGKKVWFPYQSLILFLSTIFVLESPNYALPMLLFGITWSLVTINFHAARHPNPWKRVRKMEEINTPAFLRKTFFPHNRRTINALEGQEEGRIRDRVDEIRGERISKLILEFYNFYWKAYYLYCTTYVTGDFFSTKKKKWSLLGDSVLYYPHYMLLITSYYLKEFLNFINWKGSGANIVATTCFVLASILCFLPVNKVLYWMVSIMALTFLGPWMAVVDKLFVHKWYKRSDELEALLRQGKEPGPDLPDFDALLNSNLVAKYWLKSGRLVAEDAQKLKDFREHLFGKFSETVPAVDPALYPCVPLPYSTSEPYRPLRAGPRRKKRKTGNTTMTPDHEVFIVQGQKLSGSMILKQADRDLHI